MTDEQIENLIKEEISKREITFYDMIGLHNHAVDPGPKDKSMPISKRARANKFVALMGFSRMQELLCIGEYNPYAHLQPLKVPFQDLFRFWWNRCVEKELVVEEVLDDIFQYTMEQMRPSSKEKEGMDMVMDFEQMYIFSRDRGRAA